MSQEVVIVHNCDVCQKEDKVKVSEGTESFVIKINHWEREIDLCPKHRTTKHTIDSLLDTINRYGRKLLKDKSAQLEEVEHNSFCTCGKSFEDEKRLNMHLGQMARNRPDEKHKVKK